MTEKNLIKLWRWCVYNWILKQHWIYVLNINNISQNTITNSKIYKLIQSTAQMLSKAHEKKKKKEENKWSKKHPAHVTIKHLLPSLQKFVSFYVVCPFFHDQLLYLFNYFDFLITRSITTRMCKSMFWYHCFILIQFLFILPQQLNILHNQSLILYY